MVGVRVSKLVKIFRKPREKKVVRQISSFEAVPIWACPKSVNSHILSTPARANRSTFMLLTRSLPPQFLLPAWSAQYLAAVQRVYNSTDSKDQPPAGRKGAPPREAIKESSFLNGGGIPIRRAPSDTAKVPIWHESQTESEAGDKAKNHIRGGEETSKNIPPGSRIRKFSLLDGGGISLRRGRVDTAKVPRWTEAQTESEAGHEATNHQDIPPRPPSEILSSWAPISRSAKSARSPTSATRKGGEKKEPPGQQPAEAKLKPPTKREAVSLFDALFPEEKYTKSPEQRLAEHRFDRLPAFQWTPEIKIGDQVKKEEKHNLFYDIPPRKGLGKLKRVMGEDLRAQESLAQREKGVLVLNACSKTLEESDFFRLSPQGQHIEGWKSGLLKVIPIRDNETLEPLGSYFLIFSSPAAARAYLDQTMRLHTLVRLRQQNQEAQFPLPPGYLKEGEDLEKLLKNFSLIPGSVKLSLRMLSRPYSPRVEKLIQKGGPAAIAGRKARAEHIVLFTTDRSHVTHADVGSLLKQDSKLRNLRWNISSDLQDSIIRLQNDEGEESWRQPRKGKGKVFGAGARTYSGPNRFIISFKDSHEARRFVREWHCRPMPITQTRRAEDEPPAIVNAELLW